MSKSQSVDAGRLQGAHRLFVVQPLAAGQAIVPDAAQTNYLINVLRLKAGAGVLLFNGRDGEYAAQLEFISRKSVQLVPRTLQRAQTAQASLALYFAPLKHARLDYMVQKAVEMGVGLLAPVITRRTQTTRLNLDRMRANAIEAAEQCELLGLPEIVAERPLRQVLDSWPAERLMVFCDEDAPVADPLAALRAVAGEGLARQSVAVLIGPEGGFEPGERAALLALPNVLRLSLGPRVLRADTAAVAALALVQAVLGDWRGTA